MKKRIMAAVLAALLSASAFTACSESNAGTNTDETQPAGTSPEATVTEPEETEKELTDLEKRQLIPDDLPDNKYDGAEFRVYTVDAVYADYEGEILAEEITGDACNDAVYNRNIRIEDRFDIESAWDPMRLPRRCARRWRSPAPTTTMLWQCTTSRQMKPSLRKPSSTGMTHPIRI